MNYLTVLLRDKNRDCHITHNCHIERVPAGGQEFEMGLISA